MKLWSALVALAGAGAIALAATGIPSATTTTSPVSVAGTKTIVCPAGDRAIVPSTITAAAGGQITARQIGTTAGAALPAAGLQPTAPVVLTGEQDIGGLSSATTAQTLWLAACSAPGVEAAFPGVVSDATRRATVVLTNADQTQAAVDLTILGASGRVSAPGARGITVAGNATRIVPLEALVQSGDPVTVLASASEGRVHAAIRIEGADGSDWQATSTPQGTTQVITGVPAGDGSRTLVVANPTSRRANVTVQVLGQDATFAPAGAETIDVNPESTTTVELSTALRGDVASVSLTSTQPVVASVRARVGGDVAIVGARPALGGSVRVPILAGAATIASNAGSDDETLTVTTRADDGRETGRQQVVVPHGRTVVVPEGAQGASVEFASDGPGTRVTLVATRIGEVTGIGVATLGPGSGVAATVVPAADPALGG